MAEFLLEILSEEIPARMQAKAADDLRRMVTESLAKAGLTSEAAQSYVTPRRLTLVIEGLPVAQPDISEEKRGPRVGAPEQAMAGFLASTGMSVEQLEKRDTGKGEFYFAIINKKGRPTADVLTELVLQTMANFPWPKSMRWGAHSERWVRPVQSILCLFNGVELPVSFRGIQATSVTFGHRFLADPAGIKVKNFADYFAQLPEAKVMLDPAERRHEILRQAEAAASAEGLTLRADEGLLAEVAGLVEWPSVLVGSIDDSFMAVPSEVLITSMRSHQKYFSLLNADGSLAPRFLVVSNMHPSDAIIAGNQRVLRARLSDAAFFWETDRKVRLESRLPKLEERLFYAKLGTMADKVARIRLLARHLTFYVDGAEADETERAAELAKADLSTEMVGEFPELQGIMGRYYALGDGEQPKVADAIAEHYSPLGPSDSVPSAPLSICVSLADKIDTLVGFFAIDEKPTGSKDPFALRRAALGVIRLVVENKLRLPLLPFFMMAHAQYSSSNLVHDGERVAADLLDFFADRLKVHLKEKGVRHDLVNAIFALGGEDDLVRLLHRVEALGEFLQTDDGANLLVAYRRAANIVRIEEKKDGTSYAGLADEAGLREPEEIALYRALADIREAAAHGLKAERYAEVMGALARLRQPVDSFFDKVTVNAEDAALRINRLRLLAGIGAAMGDVADFGKIEG